MITAEMIKSYKKHGGTASNTAIYKDVAEALGVENDDDFRHCIRGLQQNLSSAKYLKWSRRGVWTYCK